MVASYRKSVILLMISASILLFGYGESAHNFLEGIKIPLEKSVSSSSWMHFYNDTTTNYEAEKHELIRYHLNGAGVRSFSLLFNGWGDIKIYVASFYSTSATPLTSEESVYDAIRSRDHHLLFEFTFLRKVNQKRVADAWRLQLQHSVAAEYSSYPQYADHFNTFIQCFGPIDSGGTITIQLLSNGDTLIFDQGYVYKGTIMGYMFQYAFLSLWFGTTPVAFDLKNKLLGMQENPGNYDIFHSANNTRMHHQSHYKLAENEHAFSLQGE